MIKLRLICNDPAELEQGLALVRERLGEHVILEALRPGRRDHLVYGQLQLRPGAPVKILVDGQPGTGAMPRVRSVGPGLGR